MMWEEYLIPFLLLPWAENIFFCCPMFHSFC
jgi:hypothetical protein